jgi:hypothetical protein
MSQDLEKYLYFNVGLLRGSPALNALWQDAMRYHMIDQPGQLIAIRLTEYYEQLASGNMSPTASTPTSPPTSALPPPRDEGMQNEPPPSLNTMSREKEESTLAFNGSYREKNENTLILNNPSLANGYRQQSHSYTQETFASSSGAEQNAEEAADYWKLL